MDIAPWRKWAMITAGLFGQWLRIQFIGLRVRDAELSRIGVGQNDPAFNLAWHDWLNLENLIA